MRLVDAHIHLSDAEYKDHIDELIVDAKNAGVKALVTNSMDLETCRNDLKLAEKYGGLVFPALGIHPWNVNIISVTELEETLELIQRHASSVIAIGEIGLDYKYETVWEKQIMVFDKMLHLAENLQIPVIIHSRGTTEKIIDMLPSYKLKGVLLHWFSHPISALYKAIDNGYLITEGPSVSYSSGIREVVEIVPLTNLLTETDGPVKYWKYPYNGQLTTPSFTRLVVEAIAEIKRVPMDQVADQVAKNFENFFGIQMQ